MISFVHEPHPARVVFGAGVRSQLAAEAERLGLERLFLIGSSARVAEAARTLGARVAATEVDVVMHVPVARAESARAVARGARVDGLIALGGGSAVGLAKAVALTSPAPGLPILAVPTTYAGSEMTSVWGLTENGIKRTGRDERVRPRTVLYDPELVATLPRAIAGPSALNALAHAMEALYAPRVEPLLLAIAEESVRAIAGDLVASLQAATGEDARARVFYGAWLAGVCLDRTTVGLHHKLCHTLGGTFGLPHADVHAVILPHAAAFNLPFAPDAMRRLGRALENDDVPGALFALAERASAPTSLAALGMKESDLDRAAALATENPYDNPRPVTRSDIRALLDDAYAGRPPGRTP